MTTATQNVQHAKLQQLLTHAYNCGRSVFVQGAPGIGKSDAVMDTARALAKQLKSEGKLKTSDVYVYPEFNIDGFNVADVRLSQLDAVDIRGLPSNNNGVLTWLAPDFLAMPPETFGIILFDEFNLAPPLIQAAAYSIIYDRRVGNVLIPDGVGLVACGNRAEDRAATFDMAKPLCNRFLHVQLDNPTSDSWIEWGIDHGIDGRVLGYIEQNPDMLFRFDVDPQAKAFPTPRSWKFVSDMVLGITDWNDVQFYASTAVGVAAGHGLAAFAKLVDEVDLDEIMKNPKTADLPEAMDRIYALCSALAEKYRAKRQATTLKAVMTVSGRVKPEFGVLMLKMVKRHAASVHKADFAKLLTELGLTKHYGKFFL